METYKFVTALAAGRRVKLYYQTAGVVAGHAAQQHRLPYFEVTHARYEQIQQDAPQGFSKSTFRIVRENERDADLEWI